MRFAFFARSVTLTAFLFVFFSACSDDEAVKQSAGDGDVGERVEEQEALVGETPTLADGDEEASEAWESEEESSEFDMPSHTLLRLPVADEEGHYADRFVFGVDHDPESHSGLGMAICTNYRGEGFPYCYDGHKGTDYMLKGGFETMDLGIAFVYAAAEGEVIAVEDGNYDRCRVDPDSPTPNQVTCDGHPVRANYVQLRHDDGLVTKYYHLAKGSVLVQVGDIVACGDKLGLVGSSGKSSAPHLHFQLEDAQGNILDPYAGEYSQPESYWIEQETENGLPSERCLEDIQAQSGGF